MKKKSKMEKRTKLLAIIIIVMIFGSLIIGLMSSILTFLGQ